MAALLPAAESAAGKAPGPPRKQATACPLPGQPAVCTLGSMAVKELTHPHTHTHPEQLQQARQVAAPRGQLLRQAVALKK